MNSQQATTFDEILDDILREENEPTHDALMKWCGRYPQHQEALSRFFATWAVQKEQPKEVSIDEDRVASQLVSHALNILYRQKEHATAAEKSKAVRLSDAIEQKGLSEDHLASECGLDESIMAKLDRRLIRLASIPQLCFERVARALDCAVDTVVAMLGGEPIAVGNYKARGKPKVKLEDFMDAVNTSALSAEAKSEWARIVSSETPNRES